MSASEPCRRLAASARPGSRVPAGKSRRRISSQRQKLAAPLRCTWAVHHSKRGRSARVASQGRHCGARGAAALACQNCGAKRTRRSVSRVPADSHTGELHRTGPVLYRAKNGLSRCSAPSHVSALTACMTWPWRSTRPPPTQPRRVGDRGSQGRRPAARGSYEV
jgi:hypothetical protein